MLAAEPLIRARLATIPGVVGGVHGMADLDIQSVSGKRLPAIFVGADGYRVLDDKSPGAVKISVRWIIVVAVQQVADVVGGTDARAAVADLARQVILYRWQPAPEYQQMIPIDGPRPEYAAGVLLYPLAFETSEIIQRSEI